MDIKKKFGKRLREIRVNKNLTQEKMAESIGIQPENYSRIENGLSFPKPENIEKICFALNIELAELFQFEHLDNHNDIVEKINQKIKNDENTAILTYKFLKSLGKI